MEPVLRQGMILFLVVNELGKSIEIEISGVASNTRIDGIDIDYDVEGGNP